MSKKRLAIFIPISIIILLVLIGFALMHNKVFQVVRIIKTESNSYLWVTDKSGPNQITQKGLCDFKDITTGDKVLLLCENVVAESYPGHNTVYFCKKLESGTKDDIPSAHIEGLEEMGWKLSYELKEEQVEPGGNPYFNGEILEVGELGILVKPYTEPNKAYPSDTVYVSIDVQSNVPVPKLDVGDNIRVIHNGAFTKSNPAQVNTVFAIYLLDSEGTVLSPTPLN